MFFCLRIFGGIFLCCWPFIKRKKPGWRAYQKSLKLKALYTLITARQGKSYIRVRIFLARLRWYHFIDPFGLGCLITTEISSLSVIRSVIHQLCDKGVMATVMTASPLHGPLSALELLYCERAHIFDVSNVVCAAKDAWKIRARKIHSYGSARTLLSCVCALSPVCIESV